MGRFRQRHRRGRSRIPIIVFARCLLVCPGTGRHCLTSAGTETGVAVHNPALRGTESIDLIAGQRTLNPRARRRRSTRCRHNSRAGASLRDRDFAGDGHIRPPAGARTRRPGPHVVHRRYMSGQSEVSGDPGRPGAGRSWGRAIAATPPSARDSPPWATCHDDPPAYRVARLQADFMPMPTHQDGRDACGQFPREMRWSHLVPVMPGPASPYRAG
jgi:hypothetical protein